MLLSGIAVGSCVITILFYVVGLLHSIVIAPLIFIMSFVALLLCWALPCVVCALFIDLEKPCNRHSAFFRFYANCIVASIRQIFRVKVCVSGTEKLPREKFLLVGNHRSAMDAILKMGVFRDYRIGFVAKQELFKIPIVCKIMHKCFCLSLDRSNPRDGIRAITQAAKIIQSQSASIGIYPEGTCNTKDKLLPFKAGAFKIAQKAGCPIVVVTIRNSELAKKRMPFKKTSVFIDVIGVISADEVAKSKTTQQLSDRVQQMIENALEVQRKEYHGAYIGNRI